MFESLHYASTDVGSYINVTYLADESVAIGKLLDLAKCSPDQA